MFKRILLGFCLIIVSIAGGGVSSFYTVPLDIKVLSSEETIFQVFYADDSTFDELHSQVFSINTKINASDDLSYTGKYKAEIPVTSSEIRFDIGAKAGIKSKISDVSVFGISVYDKINLLYYSGLVEDEHNGVWKSVNQDPSTVYSVKTIFSFIQLIAALFSIFCISLLFLLFYLVCFLLKRNLKGREKTHKKSLALALTVCLATVIIFLIAYSFTHKMYGDVALSQILFHAKLENFNSFSTPGQIVESVKHVYFLLIFELVLFIAYLYVAPRYTSKYIFTVLTLSVIGLFFLNSRLQINSFLFQKQSNFIELNYAAPQLEISHLAENKSAKNLILIFMESMEWGYSEKEIYGINLLKEITRLSKEGIVFKGHVRTPGAMFTADGLASQLCGVPLVNIGFDIHKNSKNYDVLLANAPSIFSILKLNGYKTASIFGSDEHFTQLGNFFLYHGFDEVCGLRCYSSRGFSIEKNKGFAYNFSDKFTYERLKEWLNKNANTNNFAVAMQTIDTHFPTGYVSKEFVKFNDHRDSIRAASIQLNDFIGWAKRQSWYENTTIVIVGDHPWLDGPNDFTKRFTSKSKNRQALNLFLNSVYKDKGLHVEKKAYSSMDIAPTILDAIGVKYTSKLGTNNLTNDHFGLGVSLFSNKETLLSKYGEREVKKQLNRRDPFYEKLY